MNILLVYPEYPVTFWGHQYVLDLISRKAAFPPLGLFNYFLNTGNSWDVIRYFSSFNS